jgi:high-affinity iron transporter
MCDKIVCKFFANPIYCFPGWNSFREDTMRKVLWLALLGLILCLPITAVHADAPIADAKTIATETQNIRDLLDQSMRAYRLGDYTTAFKLSRSAYLDHFENIELPLRIRNADLTFDFENRFAKLRTAMQRGQSPSVVEPMLESVRSALDEVDSMFVDTGAAAPTLALVSGFSIIFREGLEAVLVLVALLGYLRSSQAQGLGRYIFYGVGFALLASALSWVIVHYLIGISPIARELLEAVISFLAVGVLFWVNFWLIRRLDQKRWMEFMKARAWSAMATGSATGLIVLGFTAVYREGLETALFYEVLALMSTRVELFLALGFILGVVGLGGVTWVILRSSRRLPIQRFFAVTVTLIMALSVAFLGNAVHSLQGSGFIGATYLFDYLPRLPEVVAQFTGFYPTVETVSAQIILTLIYLAGYVIMRIQMARRVAAPNTSAAQPAAGR